MTEEITDENVYEQMENVINSIDQEALRLLRMYLGIRMIDPDSKISPVLFKAFDQTSTSLLDISKNIPTLCEHGKKLL